MMKYIFIFLLVLFFIASSVHADVLIIANKNVSKKTLTSGEIKDIFLGKIKKWPDNTKIYLVTSGDYDLHDAFLKTYIKRTASQFGAYWKNRLFTGKGSPPKKFSTTKELMKYIADTQGAIGYIDSGSTPVNVNIISVE